MLKVFVWVSIAAISSIFLNGCMMPGMVRGGGMMHSHKAHSAAVIRDVNQSELIDEAIALALRDLSAHPLNINSLAVWQIRTGTAGLDIELIRMKLINGLVNLNKFEILSRDRLADLLKEQSLSLSGILDENSAVDFGSLIGVEGFIDGFCALEKNRFLIHLNLIDAKSGKILWSKIVEKKIGR